MNLVHKVLCWTGFHHYHSFNEQGGDGKDTPKVMHLPPGMKIDGSFCCRCHDIKLNSIEVDGVKGKVRKL